MHCCSVLLVVAVTGAMLSKSSFNSMSMSSAVSKVLWSDVEEYGGIVGHGTSIILSRFYVHFSSLLLV